MKLKGEKYMTEQLPDHDPSVDMWEEYTDLERLQRELAKGAFEGDLGYE